MCFDCFKEQIEAAYRNEHNFDSPDAFDYDVCLAVLMGLRNGEKVNVPVYDFKTHSRLEQTTTVYGANVIIFEGFPLQLLLISLSSFSYRIIRPSRQENQGYDESENLCGYRL